MPFEVDQARTKRWRRAARQAEGAAPSLDLEKEADRIVWERYAHAGLVVNDDLQILHFRGDTSPYLSRLRAKPAFSLLRMLREELQLELRAAIQKARKSGRSVRSEGIEVKQDGQIRAGERGSSAAAGSAGSARTMLSDPVRGGRPTAPGRRPARRSQGPAKGLGSGTAPVAEVNWRAPASTLQAVIRDQETTNEELKTANEEALSSMEELQSTNEELETAKEELQSSNEELVTLNEQLQNRNAELSQLSDDLSNVLSGVDIPILILGGDRRIRRFTPPAQKLLNLLPGDIGRPIGNLRVGINIPDLKELIFGGHRGTTRCGREVQSEDGRWYSLRIRPFRTAEQKIEGVLMAFVDIHELKQNQEALQKERDLVSAILDAAKDLLVMVLDPEGRIVHFNRVCQELTGYSAGRSEGTPDVGFPGGSRGGCAVKADFRGTWRRNRPPDRNPLAHQGRPPLLIGWSNAVVSARWCGGVRNCHRHRSHRAGGSTSSGRRKARPRSGHCWRPRRRRFWRSIGRAKSCWPNAATEKMFGYGRRGTDWPAIEMLVPERLREQHVRIGRNGFRNPATVPWAAGWSWPACARTERSSRSRSA